MACILQQWLHHTKSVWYSHPQIAWEVHSANICLWCVRMTASWGQPEVKAEFRLQIRTSLTARRTWSLFRLLDFFLVFCGYPVELGSLCWPSRTYVLNNCKSHFRGSHFSSVIIRHYGQKTTRLPHQSNDIACCSIVSNRVCSDLLLSRTRKNISKSYSKM